MSKTPEPKTKLIVIRSKSSRRYPADTGERVNPGVDDSLHVTKATISVVNKDCPIQIHTIKPASKPVSPERCKQCRGLKCTCKPPREPTNHQLSSKTSRTSTQSPARRSSSKQSESRFGVTPEPPEIVESDSESYGQVSSHSSYDAEEAKEEVEESQGRVQFPSISQSTRIEPGVPIRKPRLLLSIYVGRPATIFFDYPPQCMKPSRSAERVVEYSDEELERCPLTFKVSESVHTYNCFVNAYQYNGFTQITGSSFNVLMSGPPRPEQLTNFNPYQRTNHFPGAWQFGRKDNLWRNVYRMRRRFGREYEICPATFILPEDYKRFEMEREEDPKAYWIRKPVASSCGRGIKVISGTTPVKKKQYIAHPHTINGLKYDLRIYVCVTCFDPLRIYIYEDGLVRFATEKYKLDKKTIKKRYTHLTNYSVNKAAAQYRPNLDPNVTHSQADGVGSKWSLDALRKHYTTLGIDYSALFLKIHEVIIKACIAVEPHIVNNMNRATRYKTACFETYGFDILIDSALRPWLLEVNVCPSLSSSSPLDKRIKTSLMCDIFNLVGVVPFDRKVASREQDSAKQRRLLTGADKSTRPKYRGIQTLQSVHDLTDYPMCDEDWKVLLETDEELSRRGHFERIFPLRKNVDYYEQFFEAPRYNNLLVWKWLKADDGFLRKRFKREACIDSV